jgi:hypothetical protein
MKKIRIAAISTVLTLAVAACGGGDISGVSGQLAPDIDPVASASVERPWSGECNVAAAFTGPTTLHITGTCQLAHLGRVSVVAEQTIDPGPSGIGYTNVATYTAANGDELHTTNVGVATPTADGLSLSGTETAVGGTGRFQNAAGTAALNGSVRFTGPSTTIGGYTLSGRLSY